MSKKKTLLEKQMIEAMENGCDVLVYLENFEQPYRGKIHQADKHYFTLFNSGVQGGIRWTLPKADIQAFAAIIELPDENLVQKTKKSKKLCSDCPARLQVFKKPDDDGQHKAVKA